MWRFRRLTLSVVHRDHFVAELLLWSVLPLPLWAAWEHDAFCSLVLAAVYVPCVSFSWEHFGSCSKVADLRNEPRCTVLGLQLSHVEGPCRRQGGSWIHVKASCWDAGKEWKQKSIEEVWLLWCSELLADPDALVVEVALQGLQLGWSWRTLVVWGSQHQRRSMVLLSSVMDLQIPRDWLSEIQKFNCKTILEA